MKITKITVTGADDSVSPHDLVAIAKKYPMVEFGILLSRSSMGRRRFPTMGWLYDLSSVQSELHCSGHICGAWVREILKGQWPISELSSALGEGFFDRFDRWQLNTHGIRHAWSTSFIESLSNGPKEVIFQFDGKNTDVMDSAIKSGANVSALFDLSHGAGVLPDEWPSPLSGIRCGYAGGLSPANVAEQLRKLAPIVGDAEIWIDAETHLRYADDRIFDLTKVQAFIEAALKFTI